MFRAPVTVLFLVGLVERVELQLVAGVLPLLQKEWGFGDAVAGSIPTASAVAAVLATIPAGYVADRAVRTRIVAVVVSCWAVLTLGSALATGLAMFYAIRVVLAMADAWHSPASASLLADWYPAPSRPKAYGWVRVTAHLGGAGTLLGGVLGQALGWRAPFLITVVPGLLVAWLCWRLREPVRGGLDRPSTVDSRVFRNPTLVLMAGALMVLNLGLVGTFYWMPSMIHRRYGVGEGGAGALTGAATVAGVLLGTALGAWLGRRRPDRRSWLLIGSTGLLTGTAVLAAALAMDSRLAFVSLLLPAIVLMATATPTLTATAAAATGAGVRGAGFAFVQLLGTIGTALGPLVIGVVSQRTGSLVTGMYVLVVPLLIGGLLPLAALCRRAQPASSASSS